MPSEHEIQNAIVRWVALNPDHLRVWRQNAGVADFGRHRVRFGVKGWADLGAIIAPYGRVLQIEVKADKGRQSQEQKFWQEMIENHGGVYILARCVEDVWERLRAEYPDIPWATPGEVV